MEAVKIVGGEEIRIKEKGRRKTEIVKIKTREKKGVRGTTKGREKKVRRKTEGRIEAKITEIDVITPCSIGTATKVRSIKVS